MRELGEGNSFRATTAFRTTRDGADASAPRQRGGGVPPKPRARDSRCDLRSRANHCPMLFDGQGLFLRHVETRQQSRSCFSPALQRPRSMCRVCVCVRVCLC